MRPLTIYILTKDGKMKEGYTLPEYLQQVTRCIPEIYPDAIDVITEYPIDKIKLSRN